MDYTSNFYSQPSYAGGSGFPVFTGSRRQRGGSLFGSLSKSFMPIAKNVGKQLLSEGLGLATEVAGDVISGKSIKSSILNRGKERLKRLGLQTLKSMVGRGRRKRKKAVTKRKRKAKSRAPSRKRKRPRKTTSKKRSAKKRRTTNF